MIAIWNVIYILHDYNKEKVTAFCKQTLKPSKTPQIIFQTK